MGWGGRTSFWVPTCAAGSAAIDWPIIVIYILSHIICVATVAF